MQVHAPRYTVEELERADSALSRIAMELRYYYGSTYDRELLAVQRIVNAALLQAKLTQAQEVGR